MMNNWLNVLIYDMVGKIAQLVRQRTVCVCTLYAVGCRFNSQLSNYHIYLMIYYSGFVMYIMKNVYVTCIEIDRA